MTYHHALEVGKQNKFAARGRFGEALQANTAFVNLLKRQADGNDVKELLGKTTFELVQSGEQEFKLKHARWIHNGCKSETYSLRDISKSEDMFLREEVSTEETMKVSGIERYWVRNGKYVVTETKAEVGLWQVSPDMKLWAQKVGQELKEIRDRDADALTYSEVADVFYNNRENVSDDPIFEERLNTMMNRYSLSAVVLVTRDVKLCKSLASKLNLKVIRVAPFALVPFLPGRNLQEEFMALERPGAIQEYLTLLDPVPFTLIDTGSLSETLMKLTKEDIRGNQTKIWQSTVTDYGRDKRGRFQTSNLRRIVKARGKLELIPGIRDEDGRPAWEIISGLAPRKGKISIFEPYRKERKRGTSSRSSEGSWRSSTEGHLPSEHY
jgi:hypothetical protein